MPSNRIKAVLFDAGNTLIECNPSMADVVADSLRAAGVDLTPAQRAQVDPLLWRHYSHYQKTRGLRTSVDESWEFWRLVYRDISTDLGLPRPEHCADRLLKAFTQPQAWRPYADIGPTLQSLASRGIRMGVISNWTTGLHGIMEGLGLRPHFEFVLTSAEAGFEKPELAIYDAALRGRGLRPADCLYVGDSIDNDYNSSLSFGMDFALIDRADRYAHLGCRRMQDMRDLIPLLDAELAG